MAVILASQSPRRKELLKQLISNFEILPADVDETIRSDHRPTEYVMEMAHKKAQTVAENHLEDLVIASDTIVVHNQCILGKPVNRQDAKAMLVALSGSTHWVYTAVVIRQGHQVEEALVPAKVTFYPITDEEIEAYLDTGEYADKAGAYGIQGKASIFVKEIQGDYYSIVGFPVGVVHQMLKKF